MGSLCPAAAHIPGMTTTLEIAYPETDESQKLGEGVLCDAEGTPVIVDLSALDTLVIARLQDVEDHPDLLPEDEGLSGPRATLPAAPG